MGRKGILGIWDSRVHLHYSVCHWGLRELSCITLLLGEMNHSLVSQSGRRHILLILLSWTPNLQVGNLEGLLFYIVMATLPHWGSSSALQAFNELDMNHAIIGTTCSINCQLIWDLTSKTVSLKQHPNVYLTKLLDNITY